jgi:glycosyltransferase involved in cell wall biosynthesis
MFVFNDCRTDARVLREAGTLAAAGHRVTVIARPTDPASPVGDREERDGFEIVRVPVPWAWRRRWMYLRSPWRGFNRLRSIFEYGIRHPLPKGWLAAVMAVGLGLVALPWLVFRLATHSVWRAWRRMRGLSPPSGPDTLDWLVSWRFSILGWARAAGAAAGRADVYHGHDLTGLPAALEAARLNGGKVVYDSHEIFLESGANVNRPTWVRRWFGQIERGWAGRTDALVTVNHSLAEELGRRLSPRRTVVLYNTPARWEESTGRTDLIRQAAAIPAGDPIALYHGGFSAHRGLEELGLAILQPGMERVHAVFLGYGSLRGWLDREATDPLYGGRFHVLDAVPPAELVPWVASADVGVMAIQPSTLNHRLSTPNKLFECLAAGTPVVASDFQEMRRIVLDDPDGPLGEVCDPVAPQAIAAAIRRLLDLAPEAMADLRARCLQAARERWNWETESRALLELYRDLAAPAVGAADGERSGAGSA